MKEKLINHNVGFKLLAFLFAFFLWLIVVNIDDPITDRTYSDIPVTVEHIEIISAKQKTYQIIDDTQTIDVTVYAKRSVLNKIKSSDIQAFADMKELYLESMIPIEVKIAGYEYQAAAASPRNLQVKIEDNKSKSFAITPIAIGTVRDGYLLGDMKADPEKVTINGPESVIGQISRATAEVNVSGLSRSGKSEASLKFYDSNNVEIDQSLLANNLGNVGVSVDISLLETRNIPVRIDTSYVEAAEGYSVAEVTYAPQEIQLAGEKGIIEGINEILIPPEALAGEKAAKKTDFTVDIIPYLPEGVKLDRKSVV